MEGKKWAIEPLRYYMNKYYDDLDETIFFQLLILIISIDHEKIDHIFYRYFDSKYINKDTKLFLLKKALKNKRPITREMFNLICQESELDNETMFNVIYNKMGIFEYDNLIKQGKYIHLIYISKLLKLYKQNKDENQIYMEYLSVKEKYYHKWAEKIKLYFLEKLFKEFSLINKKCDMIKLFEKDIMELKYYI